MLMRKFLDLRATIHQLQQRHLEVKHVGSPSDHVSRSIADQAGSGTCLTDGEPAGHVHGAGLHTLSGSSLLRNPEIEVEFRRRTVSLLTPRKQTTWFNKDRSKEVT